MLTRGGRDG
uniref:Uncharacterized protein n=1 Tax=Arundo donax TaxID=35708 RepID=A0A0A9EWX5_ARUDO